MLYALTLDQIQLFLAVVETGSFSAAARNESRATSAITYAIQKMEEQLGLVLFDRTHYRPTLTEAGRALLPRARRVAEEVSGLRLVARSISTGLEAQLSIAVDAMFPMGLLSDALREFQARFQAVQIRISVETLGTASRLVADGQFTIGLVGEFGTTGLELNTVPAVELSLVMVAAPTHPLAQIKGPIGPEVVKDHVQLVLTDRVEVAGSRDYGVFSSQTWRLSDLAAKQEMLRAGLGFGSLPLHLARDDLARGRLVQLEMANSFGKSLEFLMVLAWRNDRPLGPATRWLIERLTASGTSQNKQLPVRQPAPQRTKSAAAKRPAARSAKSRR